MAPYYAAVRSAAAQIATHHEKQTFLKVIYENFYKVYSAKARQADQPTTSRTESSLHDERPTTLEKHG